MVTVGLMSLAFGAAAADFTVRSTVGEKVQYDDNIRLLQDSPGWVVGSTTSIDLDAKSRSETYSVGATAGANYNTFTGPGDSGLNSLDWDVGLNAERHVERTRGGISGRYREQAVRESEVEDTGGTQGDATRQTASASMNVAHELTTRDELSGVVGVRDISFDKDDPSGQLNPYIVGDVAASWSRALTATETGALKLSATYYDADNPTHTESQSYSVGASYEVRQTPNLSLRAGAGGGIVTQESDVAAGAATRDSETSPALDLDIGLRYALENAVYEASYLQGLQPSALGTLQQHRTIRLGANYVIGSEMTLAIVGLYRLQSNGVEFTPVGDADRTFASIGPELVWNFARDWRFTTGYRFRTAFDENDNSAVSNAVFVSLTYGFNLFP